jgi:hypothetical protein
MTLALAAISAAITAPLAGGPLRGDRSAASGAPRAPGATRSPGDRRGGAPRSRWRTGCRAAGQSVDRPARAPEGGRGRPMLGVQADQVVLGDQVESMLCCWLSMQIQSSLIVIGASVERAFSVRESGSRLSGSSLALTWRISGSRPAHSRLSPGLSPRLSPRLIHRLHAGLAACRYAPVCARAQPEQPRVRWQRGKRRREQTGAVAAAASLTQDQLPAHPSPRSAHSLPETTPQFLPAASSSTISQRLPSRPEPPSAPGGVNGECSDRRSPISLRRSEHPREAAQPAGTKWRFVPISLQRRPKR